jgi:hypothetical protein
MARNPGVLKISANFEPIIQAPLDARQRVGVYEDLVNPATWQDPSLNTWIFKGALVVVSTEPSAGIYWLSDNDYTNYNNWKLASSGATDGSAGVINVGDGSANIFVGHDSSGNIELRSISGIGAAVVYEDGNKIVIGLDASFSGEVNSGRNIGSGDVSLYFGKDLQVLQFKTIKGGIGINLSYSDVSTILIDTSINFAPFITESSLGSKFYWDASGFLDISVGSVPPGVITEASLGSSFVWDPSGFLEVSVGASPAGPSIDGGVWITNITPTSGGNVGDKVYSSGGAVLDSCLTDTSLLTVSVLALPGHTNYRPFVYINDVSVTISASVDKPVFTGTYAMNYNFADASITVVHEDGAHWSTRVNADTPAVIQSAVFIEGYPGAQTELKMGDTFDVSIMTDVSIVSVQVDDYGAFQAGTFTVSGNNVKITPTIANRGLVTQDLGFRIRVVKSTGSTSPNYLSETYGSTDGTYKVKLNNTYPTVTWGTILYPGTQLAIKSGEDASVGNTVTNFNTITYSSPNGQLTPANTTTYETSKKVTYLSGGYNIATDNLRIVANRAANNATTTQNTVVWIANTPTTLSVSNPATRLRSGGSDGTVAQNHTITITSSQRLLAAPTLAKDTGGTWQGGGFTWSAPATTFTRALQVVDSEAKGTFNWGAISGTNLAGLVCTTNSGSTQYILGGFVVRTITLPAFGWQADISVGVSDYTKLSSSGSGQVLAWTVLQNTRTTLGNVTRPQASTWSASATGTIPTTINILDQSATDSQSQATTFTIQEAI